MSRDGRCLWCRVYHDGDCPDKIKALAHQKRVDEALSLEAAQAVFADALDRAGKLHELDSVTILELVVALNDKLDATIRTLHSHGYEGQMHDMRNWGIE